MSTVKTQVETQAVLAFLQRHFDQPVRALEPLSGGELAQAFAFVLEEAGQETALVIRLNRSPTAFEKDQYAYTHFASPALPIPEVIHFGRFDEQLYFAISRRVTGTTLDQLDWKTVDRLWPALVETLEAIHQIVLPAETNYGDLDGQGRATSIAWRTYLQRTAAEAQAACMTLAEQTFVEREIVGSIYKEMMGLIVHCPEARYLIHGDFSFDNLLSDGQYITGVIDWGGAKVGDFLYDLAWLDFWTPPLACAERFGQHCLARGARFQHYVERLRCYQLWLGLDALRFFGLSGQEASYQWTRDRLLALGT